MKKEKIKKLKKLRVTPKQEEVFKVLEDNIHTEVFGGGAAGGSKSFLGCLWQVIRRNQYPGTRGFIARARLKNLKQSTLLTLFDVCNKLGLERGKDYFYNAIEGVVKFKNGSEIYLKDLFLYPSDPEFVSLGSTEYTDGFIDEMGEITEQAYNIMKSRIRYKLDDFGLIPKIFMGSNPCKTFVYREFYAKARDGSLESYKSYIPMFVHDNPFISDHYVENLKRLDPINKERLLNGNWEYDDDPAKLMDFDSINDLFTNSFIKREIDDDDYLIADLAMQGRDNFVVAVWRGFICEIKLVKPKATGKEIEIDLKRIAEQEKIPRSQILPDSGGMGNYLESYMEGIKTFDGARSAFDSEFANLRSECYFKLAELVNHKKIFIKCENLEWKKKITEELEQIKRDKVDKDDQKKRIVPKDTIKENLGRSPDFADVLMMRMYFEVGKFKAGVLKEGKDVFG